MRACGRACARGWRLCLQCSPAPQDRWTPLHIASHGGHLAVVEALLAKGADVEAKKNVIIARLSPLSISLTHAHTECAWLPYGDAPACMPLLLSLKTALRLQGVSAIANPRLCQSGSGPQRDTVHDESMQQCEISVSTPARYTFSPRLSQP